MAALILKPLQSALDDGDRIHAVIRGSAVNNDGALKMTYAAPAVAGQAEVIAEAHAVADVDASTIGYVETHGTGTRWVTRSRSKRCDRLSTPPRVSGPPRASWAR